MIHKKGKFTLQFLGGAGTVTGSKTLIRTTHHKILIDCGLFQGLRNLRRLNWADFPLDPKEIEAVILTHGHLDHVGYLPLLVKNGFKGNIHCTAPTESIAKIILEDSAKLQEEDANRANRYKYSKHEIAKPLYTLDDAMKVSHLFVNHRYDEWIRLNDDMKLRFRNSGHILGSSFVEIDCLGEIIVFSGDVGRSKPLILHPRVNIDKADYLIMESTYGDRLHAPINPKDELEKIILHTIEKGGNIIIPSFAVERTQEMLMLLHELKREQKIPDIPIYLDSPMGINITELMCEYSSWHTLSNKECYNITSNVHLIREYRNTLKTIKDKKKKIIIAGSGMITGGRVLSYLKEYIGDPKNTILLVGYQAIGTRGRSLRNGVSELKFYGHYYPVHIEVREISSLSAHADQKELIQWLKHFKKKPKKIFLNHGEPSASHTLRVKIKDICGCECEIPNMGDEYILD